jgi:hypothetical protein
MLEIRLPEDGRDKGQLQLWCLGALPKEGREILRYAPFATLLRAGRITTRASLSTREEDVNLPHQDTSRRNRLAPADAVEFRHGAFHFFACGICRGADALDAQAEIVWVGGAQDCFFDRDQVAGI